MTNLTLNIPEPYYPETNNIPSNFLLLKDGKVIPVGYADHYPVAHALDIFEDNTWMVVSRQSSDIVNIRVRRPKITKKQRALLEDYILFNFPSDGFMGSLLILCRLCSFHNESFCLKDRIYYITCEVSSMKIIRSAKCSLKFANSGKIKKLRLILSEYGKVVNFFIDAFWEDCPKKGELLKPIIDLPETWLSHRLRKVAAREAIDLIKSAVEVAKERETDPVKPKHSGRIMSCSSTIVELRPSKTKDFDAWLHLYSIGEKIILDLPIKFHKHYHKWNELGRRLNAYVITTEYVQFCFKVETGPKDPTDKCVGLDTGIKALASLSTGEQLGTDIEDLINKLKRCKRGSKRQQRLSRALRQRMNEVARDVCLLCTLVVVERLKGITKNTKKKKRLGRSMRSAIGWWNVSYWLKRLQRTCEETNVSFRTVWPWNTSIDCHHCGHSDRRNRSGEEFLCRKCGHSDNSDVNASKNILERFLSGPYGAGCQPLPMDICL